MVGVSVSQGIAPCGSLGLRRNSLVLASVAIQLALATAVILSASASVAILAALATASTSAAIQTAKTFSQRVRHSWVHVIFQKIFMTSIIGVGHPLIP
jgi:hypothetical protein